eukprot:Trichotokara_eunicae@DN5159_c0_g1_i2.p1
MSGGSNQRNTLEMLKHQEALAMRHFIETKHIVSQWNDLTPKEAKWVQELANALLSYNAPSERERALDHFFAQKRIEAVLDSKVKVHWTNPTVATIRYGTAKKTTRWEENVSVIPLKIIQRTFDVVAASCSAVLGPYHGMNMLSASSVATKSPSMFWSLYLVFEARHVVENIGRLATSALIKGGGYQSSEKPFPNPPPLVGHV